MGDQATVVTTAEGKALLAQPRKVQATESGWPPQRFSMYILAAGMVALLALASCFTEVPWGRLFFWLYDANMALLLGDVMWGYLLLLGCVVPLQAHRYAQLRRSIVAIKEHRFLREHGEAFKAYKQRVLWTGDLLDHLLLYTVGWFIGSCLCALMVHAAVVFSSAEVAELIKAHLTDSMPTGASCVFGLSLISGLRLSEMAKALD